MTQPTVSVVVVSWDRPEALALCLTGLSQLYYKNFEIILVANAASRAGVLDLDFLDQVKMVPFEVANISAARNAGVAEAGGDIVAFIDDDAVPEPTWLDHLIAPFADQSVSAAGGYVIGRNGISFQWKGRMAFVDGQCVDLPIEGTAPKVFQGEPGRAIKTEGTNMAVRRSVLSDLGGFDTAFVFFLDETDVNMRLAAAGHRTAIVPLAQVHHGYAPSSRRTRRRVPRDLRDIGRSVAIFARKHGADIGTTEITYEQQQRLRLLAFMRAGDILPGDVGRLLKGFRRGWTEGLSAPYDQTDQLVEFPTFHPFKDMLNEDAVQVLVGRFWQRKRLINKAVETVERGKRTTLYLFSLTALHHYVFYERPGVWIQKGGQFGRVARDEPALTLQTAKSRVRQQNERIKAVRMKNPADSVEKFGDAKKQ